MSESPGQMAEEPAADSAALLGDVLRANPIGIAVSDADGRLLYANDAAAAPAADRQVKRDQRVVAVGAASYSVVTVIDVTEQTRVEDRLFRCAYFDDLTGLPNRRLIEQTVSSLIETGGPDGVFAIAFVDIDNFKHINDYYGHAIGDGLLAGIAQRITDEIRPSDVLARVGGDEFVLLLTPIHDFAALAARMEGLLLRLKEPFVIDGYEIFSSASIGVSLHPDHGRDYHALRINADSAMYRIKSASKGGVRLFDPEIGHLAAERMKIEQRLRFAIRDRRLCCAFQPKVDFHTDTVVGIEVLLRWRDEQGVIHAPGDFIMLAVELGLMDEITLMVLSETVEKIDWINEAFGPAATISINVAAKQAGDLAFMTVFCEALEATGYADRFMVELTEEAYLAKSQFQARILPMLRTIGTRISIDDFGVGYSSLSALADITADEIKVDRSFITDIHKKPRNQSILKVIETLGQALGMSILVEGVETFEEMVYLKTATRIRLAQGFYFAKPLMLDDGAASQAGAISRTRAPSRETGAARLRAQGRR